MAAGFITDIIRMVNESISSDDENKVNIDEDEVEEQLNEDSNDDSDTNDATDEDESTNEEGPTNGSTKGSDESVELDITDYLPASKEFNSDPFDKRRIRLNKEYLRKVRSIKFNESTSEDELIKLLYELEVNKTQLNIDSDRIDELQAKKEKSWSNELLGDINDAIRRYNNDLDKVEYGDEEGDEELTSIREKEDRVADRKDADLLDKLMLILPLITGSEHGLRGVIEWKIKGLAKKLSKRFKLKLGKFKKIKSSKLYQKLSTILGGIKIKVGNILDDIVRKLHSLVDDLVERAGRGVLGSIGDWFSRQWSNARSMAGRVWDAATGVAKSGWDWVATKAGTAAGYVVDAYKTARNWVDTASGRLGRIADDVVDTVSNLITKYGGEALNFIKTQGDELLEWLAKNSDNIVKIVSKFRVAGKQVPVLGTILGIAFGLYRGLHDGDWAGAGLEALSGVLNDLSILVGGLSFGAAVPLSVAMRVASYGIDAALLAKDLGLVGEGEDAPEIETIDDNDNEVNAEDYLNSIIEDVPEAGAGAPDFYGNKMYDYAPIKTSNFNEESSIPQSSSSDNLALITNNIFNTHNHSKSITHIKNKDCRISYI